MRAWTFALAAIVFCGSAQGTEAGAKLAPLKAVSVGYYPGVRAVRAGFAPAAAGIAPARVAECANLAGIRALGAKATGADIANQGRLAELTFVLCLAGSPAES